MHDEPADRLQQRLDEIGRRPTLGELAGGNEQCAACGCRMFRVITRKAATTVKACRNCNRPTEVPNR